MRCVAGNVNANSSRWFSRAGAATHGTTAITVGASVDEAAGTVVLDVRETVVVAAAETGAADGCGTTDANGEVLGAAR